MQRCSFCPQNHSLFKKLIFLALLLQCLENYVLLWRMQLSLVVLCPLIVVLEVGAFIPLHLTAELLPAVQVCSLWDESSFNPSPTHSTFTKPLLGLQLLQAVEKSPFAASLTARCVMGRPRKHTSLFPSPRPACKVQSLIPGMDNAEAGEEQIGPQPAVEQGGTAVRIDLRLRNQRWLYYIIIDVAGKCHRQSTAYYLLCCIVSLVCVGPLCFASCVPIACLFIPCAFSFHISPVNPTWKNQL